MTSILSPADPLDTAVLFLVFNRPDTTARVFEAIRQAKPPRLYVAGDGPREGRAGEAERIAKVRQIATKIDWPCELKTLFRVHNLGCKYAVSGAIDWFFDNEDYGIILEDDVLPAEGFFHYCQGALTKYRDDPRVGFVAGHSVETKKEFLVNGYSTKFSSNALVWGWATWKRVWNQYDVELADWDPQDLDFLWKKNISSRLYVDMWRHIFDKVKSGEIDTWDYQLMYLLFSSDLLCVVPPYNLVDNLGFGEDATHTIASRPAWLINSSSIELKNVHFSQPDLDIALDREIMRKIYRITPFAEIKNFVKILIGYGARKK